jgi:hypothetical protein
MLRIRKMQETQYSQALVAGIAAMVVTAAIAIISWYFFFPGERVIFVIAGENAGFFAQAVEEPVSTSVLSTGFFCTILGLAVSLGYSILHYRRQLAQRADISEVEIVAFHKRDFRNMLAWISMSVVTCLMVTLGTDLSFQLMGIIARETLFVPPAVAIIVSVGYVGLLAFSVSRWMLALLTIDILATGTLVLIVGVTLAILMTSYADWYENPFSVLGEFVRDDTGTIINERSALIFSYTFIAVGFLMLAYFLDMLKLFSIMVEYGHLQRRFSLLIFIVGCAGSVGMLLVGFVQDGFFHNMGAQAAGLAFVGMMLAIPWFVPTREGRDIRFVIFSAGLGVLSILLYVYHLLFPQYFNLLGMELAGISFTVIFLYTFTIHNLSYMESLDLPDVSHQAQEIRGTEEKAEGEAKAA